MVQRPPSSTLFPYTTLFRSELFERPEAQQRRLGYFHTLQEICQQPWTWLRTCERMIASRDGLKEDLKGIQSLALTGSGSSEYAAECVRSPLQNELGIPTESISGGALLMYGAKVLPPGRPGLLVSVARSGDSPESNGVVELLLGTEPQIRHLVVTCNEQGRLAKAWLENRNARSEERRVGKEGMDSSGVNWETDRW